MQQSTTVPTPAFIDLNVLPEELRPRRYPTWYVLGIVAILAASLLLIPLYRAERTADAETARTQSELALLDHTLAQLQIDFGRRRELQEQLARTEAAIAQLHTERQVVLGDREMLSQDLSAIREALPRDVRLATVISSDTTLTVTGRASALRSVLDYASVLASGQFASARVTSLATTSTKEGGTEVAFAVEVPR